MARKPKSDTSSSRIALLREERGWTQAELAEKMMLPQRTVSDIERGVNQSLPNYISLAVIFGVSLDYIAGLSDNRPETDELNARAVNLLNKLPDKEKLRIIKHIEFDLSL